MQQRVVRDGEPVRLPVDGDDGAVFHLMRRVLQQHGPDGRPPCPR